MIGKNIFKIRKEILNLSRVDFALKTGISEHTLRRLEKEEIALSAKSKIKIIDSFKLLGVEVSENFLTYEVNNDSKNSSFDFEYENDLRMEEFIRLIKRIYNNIFYIKLNDDKLGGLFKKYSIAFGNKKYDSFEDYIGEYCIVSFKKTRKIRQKKAILRKIKSIDKKFKKIILEKVKGENTDLKIQLIFIDFICPIFCVRMFNDYYP